MDPNLTWQQLLMDGWVQFRVLGFAGSNFAARLNAGLVGYHYLDLNYRPNSDDITCVYTQVRFQLFCVFCCLS